MKTWRHELERTLNPLLQKDDIPHFTGGVRPPAADIQEEADRYGLYADIHGVQAKNIGITMEQDVLTLHGESRFEVRQEEENYKPIERLQGHFHRRFTLPEHTDPETIIARNQTAVLEELIPKGSRLNVNALRSFTRSNKGPLTAPCSDRFCSAVDQNLKINPRLVSNCGSRLPPTRRLQPPSQNRVELESVRLP